MKLKRNYFIQRIRTEPSWDLLVIGGGSTGLGCALDAASRGLKTLLVERGDFAKGTSSRSTKLVHGGVRYLAQGNIGLVYEALRERGLMLRNAPHLVHRQSFIIPCYSQWSRFKFLFGLQLYDWLAGRHSFGSSTLLSAATVQQRLPGVNPAGLTGGVEYFDGQFDDARFAVNLAQTCAEKGCTPINYMKVTGLLKEPDGRLTGAIAYDLESNEQHIIRAKAVINATGIFVDEILEMDIAGRPPLVRPSQGIHLVLPLSFLKGNNAPAGSASPGSNNVFPDNSNGSHGSSNASPGSGSALMIPSTTDGRVLFAVPWHDHLLLGTTDTPLNKHDIEPRALEEEIEFVLKNAKRYLRFPPERKDILSIFAGLRPLAAPTGDQQNATKEISRSHKLITHPSGLITITGGKWTTYRKMAQDTVDQAIRTAGLPSGICVTHDLPIHGSVSTSRAPENDPLAIYGSDAALIRQLIAARPELDELLIEGFPYRKAEVVWAVQAEMARTVEDVLARRLRLLFLDAAAAINAAPATAALIAAELNRDQDWERRQVLDFVTLAYQYSAQPAPLPKASV